MNNTQITQLKKENQELKDLMIDVSGIIGRDIRDFGMMDKEIHAKIKSVVSGVKYNPKDWDMAERIAIPNA